MLSVDTPIIGQIICFIYLTFIPGLIIIRILKLNNVASIEKGLYAIGLSLTLLMVIGLVINMVYPILGIHNPISRIPLVISIGVVVIILCVYCFIKDGKFYEKGNFRYLDIDNYLRIPALILYLLPLLSIYGTFFVNSYDSNILLLLLIVMISIIVLLIGLDVYDEKYYNLIILSVSLSLVFYTALLTMHLTGFDIQIEYHQTKAVIDSGHWDLQLFNASNINSMLSIVILGPIYSILTNFDPVWVFKIYYPVLYSLVPLGLYCFYKRIFNNKISLLSILFFIFLYTFFTEMIALARQEIAELFLALILLVISDNLLSKNKRILLFILFSFALIVSHYGVTYIFGIILMFVYVYNLIFKDKKVSNIISFNIVAIYLVMTIIWYIYTSDSSVFNSIINIGNNISDKFMIDTFKSPICGGYKDHS